MDIGKIKFKGYVSTYVLICSYLAFSCSREGSTVSSHTNIFKCFHSSDFRVLRNNFMTAVLWNIPAVTTHGCPGSNSEVNFEVWYQFSAFKLPKIFYRCIWRTRFSYHTVRREKYKQGPIKLHFFHLLQIFIVFFIPVYGENPNVLNAVVSSGFIELFGFALRWYLDVFPKRKKGSTDRVCLGKHTVRDYEGYSFITRREKMRPETCSRSSKWASNLCLESQSLSILLFSGLHHLLSYYKIVLAPGLLWLESLPQDIWRW